MKDAPTPTIRHYVRGIVGCKITGDVEVQTGPLYNTDKWWGPELDKWLMISPSDSGRHDYRHYIRSGHLVDDGLGGQADVVVNDQKFPVGIPSGIERWSSEPSQYQSNDDRYGDVINSLMNTDWITEVFADICSRAGIEPYTENHLDHVNSLAKDMAELIAAAHRAKWLSDEEREQRADEADWAKFGLD